jgi:hypothetical protein
LGDKARTAKKERPQEYFTELGVRLHNPKQRRPIDFQKLARLADASADQATAAGEHVNLPGELACLMDHHGGFAVPGRGDDLDAALDHNEKSPVRLTLIEQHFTCRRSAPMAEWLEASELRGVEFGKHRLAVF